MIQARWTFSREEWRSFLFRHHKQDSLVRKLVQWAGILSRSPEIVFSTNALNIGEMELSWREVREINLYEEGNVNVMRLVLAEKEIAVPIPKGRLREALELRSRLASLPNSTF